MTENKNGKVIRILPNKSQKEIRSVLKRKTFTEEIYIPMNLNRIKKNNTKKHLMINTIYNYNNNYKTQNKYLSQLIRENSEFSKRHSIISIMNRKNKSKEKRIYGNLMKLYINKGYDPSKLMINNNIFDDSILLTNHSYTNIIRINGEKEIKKDEKSLKILKNYIIKNKEGKNFGLEDLSEDDNKINENFYPENYNFKKNNLLLKYDILRTKQAINNLVHSESINKNRTFSNISLKQNYSNSENEDKINSSIDKDKFSNDKNININLYQKNKNIYSRQALNLNKYKRNNTYNISKNFSSDNKLTLFNKKELKKTFSLNDNKEERKISFLKLHNRNKHNHLTQLYENIKKSNYKENEKNISNYLEEKNIKVETKQK